MRIIISFDLDDDFIRSQSEDYDDFVAELTEEIEMIVHDKCDDTGEEVKNFTVITQ